MPQQKGDLPDVGVAINVLENKYQQSDRRLTRFEQKIIRDTVKAIFRIKYDANNPESLKQRDAQAASMLEEMDKRLEEKFKETA